jgi:hypothetical protein
MSVRQNTTAKLNNDFLINKKKSKKYFVFLQRYLVPMRLNRESGGNPGQFPLL